ncbi:hypothetical protein Leryth_007209 [Lithospermum erythrorhizon]|nr:hypothetical protein Leryth_007209 [Lithospermum erythrorhizon]
MEMMAPISLRSSKPFMDHNAVAVASLLLPFARTSKTKWSIEFSFMFRRCRLFKEFCRTSNGTSIASSDIICGGGLVSSSQSGKVDEKLVGQEVKKDLAISIQR